MRQLLIDAIERGNLIRARQILCVMKALGKEPPKKAQDLIRRLLS